MKEQSVVDVLICGAGAAGLTLASDLARRGIAFRLIDKLDGPFAGSRGKGIQPRTLELFEDLGVVDRIAAAGSTYPPQRVHHADGSHADAQDIAIEPATAQEPYRTPLLVPQSRTEAVLRTRLAEFGAAPEYGCALHAFEQDGDGVTAHVGARGGIDRIRCRYLVGGDGGRSFVRQALDLDFPGKTLDVRAMVADIVMTGLPRDAWHRFNEGDMARQISFCPLPHSDLFQLQAPMPADGEAELDVAGIQAFIDARLPRQGIVVGRVAWASAYSMNARLAERYRVGRVFLMGDAAHIHPPTGGQGLNTSVQDAYNLGWKLDAVLAGAPEALLDTYEEERRPIAAAMLGLATGLLEKAKQGDMRRGREVHQLDLAYPESPLSLELPARQSGVPAGARAPDALLVGAGGQPRRLFDLIAGPHWTLIARGPAIAALSVPHRRLRILTIGDDGELRDPDGAFQRLYCLAEGDMLLVRPDGYVGASIAAAEAGRLEDYLANILPGAATS